MDESLFWTKVAAIGQVAGAAATFLAAWVALYLGRTDRQFRLRVTATFQNIVSSHGSIKVMCIQVENIGMRTARIEGFGWTTGYANVWRFLPKALRLRSVHKLPVSEWAINKKFTWTSEESRVGNEWVRKYK